MTDIVTRLKQYIADESGWQDADGLIIEAIVNIEQMRDGLIDLTVMDTAPRDGSDPTGAQYVGPFGTYANKVLNRSRGIIK
jgi:hypothetical protein